MGTQEQPTEIGVEDLTAKLKEANFFRVRYFAKKHNDYIVRYGVVDDKMNYGKIAKRKYVLHILIYNNKAIALQKISIGYNRQV